MKLFTLILLMGLFAGCVIQPQQYYIKTVPSPKEQIATVAVIPENWDTYWISSFAYRALITELMDVGFTVVERSNLMSILNEQELQQSGLTKENETQNFETRTLDKTSIAKLGEMLGVDKLVLIYVVPSERKLNMATIRLVDVETGKILTSTTVLTLNSGQDADIIMKQVALDIASVIENQEKIVRDELFGGQVTPEQSKNRFLRRTGDDLLKK